MYCLDTPNFRTLVVVIGFKSGTIIATCTIVYIQPLAFIGDIAFAFDSSQRNSECVCVRIYMIKSKRSKKMLREREREIE